MILAHLTWPDLGLVASLFLLALVAGSAGRRHLARRERARRTR